MTFFILSNTFLEDVKLHVFRRKKLDTLGDALTRERERERMWVQVPPPAWGLPPPDNFFAICFGLYSDRNFSEGHIQHMTMPSLLCALC
jgi:hypothetical protein